MCDFKRNIIPTYSILLFILYEKAYFSQPHLWYQSHFVSAILTSIQWTLKHFFSDRPQCSGIVFWIPLNILIWLQTLFPKRKLLYWTNTNGNSGIYSQSLDGRADDQTDETTQVRNTLQFCWKVYNSLNGFFFHS